MAEREARVTFWGRIHDEDTWPDKDEEGDYNFSQTLTLDVDGEERNLVRTHNVDGEVDLRVNIGFRVDENETLHVNGIAELWEGGAWWTNDDSYAITGVQIQPNETEHILNGHKLKNDGGDWITMNLQVTNNPSK